MSKLSTLYVFSAMIACVSEARVWVPNADLRKRVGESLERRDTVKAEHCTKWSNRNMSSVSALTRIKPGIFCVLVQMLHYGLVARPAARPI